MAGEILKKRNFAEAEKFIYRYGVIGTFENIQIWLYIDGRLELEKQDTEDKNKQSSACCPAACEFPDTEKPAQGKIAESIENDVKYFPDVYESLRLQRQDIREFKHERTGSNGERTGKRNDNNLWIMRSHTYGTDFLQRIWHFQRNLVRSFSFHFRFL